MFYLRLIRKVGQHPTHLQEIFLSTMGNYVNLLLMSLLALFLSYQAVFNVNTYIQLKDALVQFRKVVIVKSNDIFFRFPWAND